jgi:hypothetical protein
LRQRARRQQAKGKIDPWSGQNDDRHRSKNDDQDRWSYTKISPVSPFESRMITSVATWFSSRQLPFVGPHRLDLIHCPVLLMFRASAFTTALPNAAMSMQV